jgi:hypothetical protein
MFCANCAACNGTLGTIPPSPLGLLSENRRILYRDPIARVARPHAGFPGEPIPETRSDPRDLRSALTAAGHRQALRPYSRQTFPRSRPSRDATWRSPRPGTWTCWAEAASFPRRARGCGRRPRRKAWIDRAAGQDQAIDRQGVVRVGPDRTTTLVANSPESSISPNRARWVALRSGVGSPRHLNAIRHQCHRCVHPTFHGDDESFSPRALAPRSVAPRMRLARLPTGTLWHIMRKSDLLRQVPPKVRRDGTQPGGGRVVSFDQLGNRILRGA